MNASDRLRVMSGPPAIGVVYIGSDPASEEIIKLPFGEIS